MVFLDLDGKVGVDFGRKVSLVLSIMKKTLHYFNMANISLTERALEKRFHAHENSKCNHSMKHNCDEVSK